MRALVVDHLQRQRNWWVWILTLHFIFALAFIIGLSPVLPIIGCLLMSSTMGGSNNLVTPERWVLPVSKRGMDLAHWWLCFGFLGLAITIINLLAALDAELFQQRIRGYADIALATLSSWGILGVPLVGPPIFSLISRLIGGLPKSIRFGFVLVSFALGVLLPIVAVLGVNAALLGLPDGYVERVVLIVAAVLSIIGGLSMYGRSTQNAQPRSASAGTSSRRRGRSMQRLNMNGWKVVARQHRLILTVPFLIAVIAIVLLRGNAGAVVIIAALVSPILIPFVMSPWISSRRVFQTLPITKRQVAFRFLILANIPSCGALLLLFIFARITSTTGDALSYGILLIVLAPICLQSIALAIALRARQPAVASLLILAILIVVVVFTISLPRSMSMAGLAVYPLIAVVGFLWVFVAAANWLHSQSTNRTI